ncbi:DinB family protein [Daejeonella lutea]|uniref:DinB superfamily protein n=1 Tax=Daejeonella lutea TaxID=572036 RepID=A0A1T5DTC6_9SPHI|nr:DinB family protein [Daejeonella lutea]SKB74760.1 DinB superfamily protein [Daejeonella lutea]
MKRPRADEYAAFYGKYIDTVSDNVIAELEHQANSFTTFLKGLTQDKASYAYAEGKWTIKELVGHIIDTERIMAYRLLTIARNDQTPLPGFEEDDYVLNARFADRTLDSLADEFAIVRKANMYLVKSLNEDEIGRVSSANGSPISVLALIYILAGHLNHHRNIIEERYL